jgi:hypothetical protein
MERIDTFSHYLAKVKQIIKENRGQMNDIGKTIRWLDFQECEVEPNIGYFRESYEAEIIPEQAICYLRNNIDELYRKISDFDDNVILNEVSSRNLEQDIIRNAWTTDLEDEINDRSDTNFVNKYALDTDELMDLLKMNNNTYNSSKEAICEALGFYNSFSYSLDEVINKIKEIW